MSNLTNNEKLTKDSYNSMAQEWANSRSNSQFLQEEFELFKSYCPSGKILEIGVGSGADAEKFINAGYSYVGTDISQSMIAVAKKRVPNAQFLNQSTDDFNFLDNAFDGFWTAATLLHIPKSKIEYVLQTLHTITKKNGYGLITLKNGVGEKVVDDKLPNGKILHRFFAYYSQDEFSQILEKNKFEVIKTHTKDGKDANWNIFLVTVIK